MAEKIALVLDGGGFNGVKARGIAKSLWQRRKIPEKIQGVSVGAINAAKLVESGADEMEAGWLRMAAGHPEDIFKIDYTRLILHPIEWLKSNTVYTDEGLIKLLGRLDPQKIIDSPIELEVVVHNETDGEMQVFSSRDELFRSNPRLIIDAVKASASLTGIFPPVEIAGKYYSDGYYFHLERISGFDTVFIVLNDDPVLKINPHSNKFRRLFAGASRVLDDKIKDQIKRFLEQHKDEFGEFKISSQNNVLLRMFDGFIKGVAKVVLGKGRVVLITPNYSIPTLEMARFERTTYRRGGVIEKLGDIETAMELSFRQSEALMKEVYPD